MKEKKMEWQSTAEPRTMIDNIPVYCSYDDIVDVQKVVGNPRNPNTHGEEQTQLLAKIIKAQGWRNNITVSTRSGFIVRGHGRLASALLLGVSKVPVEYQNYASEAEEYADLIADNRIAELSEINNTELSDILKELTETDIDMDLTGFVDEELDKMLEFAEEEEEPEPEEAKKELPDVPMSRMGDAWELGNLILTCNSDIDIELKIADAMVGLYVEHTGNITALCTRDGREIPYIDLIREYAQEYDVTDILMSKKIPIITLKKK